MRISTMLVLFGLCLASPLMAQDKVIKEQAVNQLQGRDILGQTVYNSHKEKLGFIVDILFEDGVVKAYIVAVGGFLGIGEKHVAVESRQFTITRGTDGFPITVVLSMARGELYKAPAFNTLADLKAIKSIKNCECK